MLYRQPTFYLQLPAFRNFDVRVHSKHNRGQILSDLTFPNNLGLINKPIIPTSYNHNGSSTIELVFLLMYRYPMSQILEVENRRWQNTATFLQQFFYILPKIAKRLSHSYYQYSWTMYQVHWLTKTYIDDISNSVTKAIQHSAVSSKREV